MLNGNPGVGGGAGVFACPPFFCQALRKLTPTAPSMVRRLVGFTCSPLLTVQNRRRSWAGSSWASQLTLAVLIREVVWLSRCVHTPVDVTSSYGVWPGTENEAVVAWVCHESESLRVMSRVTPAVAL